MAVDVVIHLRPGVSEQFAQSAADGLVGQRTRVKVNGRAVAGRITAAVLEDDGAVRVTVRVQ